MTLAIDFAKRYREGEVELVIEISSWPNHAIYHLVFCAVPNGAQQPVEALAVHTVECDEKIVPSRIRLERPKERNDLRREIFAAASYGVLELVGNVGKNGRGWPFEFDLVGAANSIRVRLDGSNIGVFLEEGLSLQIECTDVMVCSVEPPLWTSERIDHG